MRFEAKVNAVVPQSLKDDYAEVLAADRGVLRETTEGDVIRLALLVALPVLVGMGAQDRVAAYGRIKQGLPLAS